VGKGPKEREKKATRQILIAYVGGNRNISLSNQQYNPLVLKILKNSNR
jgi:hypothetical protein